MLVQLKCKTCNSTLKAENGSKTFICESCSSRYVFVDEDEGEIIDVKELVGDGYKDLKKGNFDDALDSFELYVDECGLPDYDAYLGYILSRFECRTIKQLSKVAYAEAFEISEWKTLLEVAGEHKDELLTAKEESCKNFKKKMKTNAERQDAEVINAKELYLMYVAEYRELENASEIREIAGKDEFFDSLHSYYIIPCTAKDKPAEFYLPAIKKACRFGHNETVIVIPEPAESMKDEFLEEIYEYHMSNDVNIMLVFLNDIKQIERIYRYSQKVNYNSQYDVPDALYCGVEAYLQGNQLVLLGGNVEDADADPDIKRRVSDDRLRRSTDELRKSVEESERQQEEKETAVNQRAAWIRAKKCRHCGGDFIGGFFSKTCSLCGKKKDY